MRACHATIKVIKSWGGGGYVTGNDYNYRHARQLETANMGWGQSKESGVTEEVQQEERPVDRGLSVETTYASVQSRYQQPTTAIQVEETEKKRVLLTSDTSAVSSNVAKGDYRKREDTQADHESGVEFTQHPVQPNGIKQSETSTDPSPMDTVLGSHHGKQAVVEVREKKLLILADTAKSHSIGTTLRPAPESLLLSGASRATAEPLRSDKHLKGTQEKSESAQGNLDSEQGPRVQDGSDHASKKPIQRMRYKHTRCYGE